METTPDQSPPRIVHREAAKKAAAEAWILRERIQRGIMDSPEQKARLALEGNSGLI